MPKFIDLSHTFKDRMPGFKLKNEDDSYTQYTSEIKPFLTHEQSLPKFDGKASFEITEISFQTSVGTYLDSPYHRYSDNRDISNIRIDEVILPGEVIDVRYKEAFEPLGCEALPKNINVNGKAVLFNFGWDQYWGEETYYSYPYISKELVRYLISQGAKLVGVDTLNIDNANDLYRPAHTLFLEKDILIVENLTGLEKLYNNEFRFFAVPWKAEKVAALPIRAFAEIIE
ncbi:cyclase family protein [Salicibibacter cibarius]|uniref:Cyclase family protein n=1 Tax=Salicibibacter cibarius TaxID=2743000 RepID=A0A7T7CBT7_9BACI|nr:cyclase family protein [Salicibibacter cibarius]QQK76174.1 cyclase family protein [Salicibibacter cibarius]